MREAHFLWIKNQSFFFLSTQTAARVTSEISAVPPMTVPPQPVEVFVSFDADVAEVSVAIVELLVPLNADVAGVLSAVVELTPSVVGDCSI